MCLKINIFFSKIICILVLQHQVHQGLGTQPCLVVSSLNFLYVMNLILRHLFFLHFRKGDQASPNTQFPCGGGGGHQTKSTSSSSSVSLDTLPYGTSVAEAHAHTTTTVFPPSCFKGEFIQNPLSIQSKKRFLLCIVQNQAPVFKTPVFSTRERQHFFHKQHNDTVLHSLFAIQSILKVTFTQFTGNCLSALYNVITSTFFIYIRQILHLILLYLKVFKNTHLAKYKKGMFIVDGS